MGYDQLVTIRCPPCMVCKVRHELAVPKTGLQKYANGALVQQAFPTLSASDRELLISGTCQKAWDELFPAEDKEDTI